MNRWESDRWSEASERERERRVAEEARHAFDDPAPRSYDRVPNGTKPPMPATKALLRDLTDAHQATMAGLLRDALRKDGRGDLT